MLSIRNDQMAALQVVMDNQLAIRLAERFAERYPGYPADRAALIASIRTGIARARRYELDRLVDISTYVDFHLLIGPWFDEHPSIHAILTDRGIPTELLMSQLIELIPTEKWQAAAIASRTRENAA